MYSLQQVHVNWMAAQRTVPVVQPGGLSLRRSPRRPPEGPQPPEMLFEGRPQVVASGGSAPTDLFSAGLAQRGGALGRALEKHPLAAITSTGPFVVLGCRTWIIAANSPSAITVAWI